MKLIRLHVENFGTLHDFELSFTDGMNLLYQKNGWGKSTLAVFIKAMLYGLPASTKRSLDENERKKYMPWQGGAYGGSLEFECVRGSFRVERFFGAKESGDSFALYDLSTNKPSNIYSTALGEELFGIDADGFERSTYLSQRALGGSKDSGSIAAKLGNLLDDVDDIGNYEVALSALDKRRRYYVMQGNRGAIAELDEAIQAGQRELEGCRRTEEAMRAQEETLAQKLTELKAVRKTASENRERLTKAGLAGERKALLEQKTRMQEEINERIQAREQVDAFFDGSVPSVEDLNDARKLLKEIDTAEAELQSLQVSSANADQANRLKQRFAGGVPSVDAIEAARGEQERLPELRARREVLRSGATESLSSRFSMGLPSSDRIEEARQSLSQARSLQVSIDTFLQTDHQKNGSTLPTVFAVLGCVLGAILVAISFLPPFQEVFLLPLTVGGLSLVLGLVFVALHQARRIEERRRKREMRLRIEEWKNKRERCLKTVKDFLTQFNMPTDDLERSLGELVLECDQHRKTSGQVARWREELERLQRTEEEILGRLHRFLSRYFVNLEKKSDYNTELNRLQSDLQTLRHLRAEEQERVKQRAEADQRLKLLRDRLVPFLRRYDKTGSMTPTECLDRVSDCLAERRRLERELEVRSFELGRFIAEKGLESAESIPVADSIEDLNREERELRQRTTDLENVCANLRSRIEHFSVDVDRIPEIEAELVRLRVARDEAKANAATITHTAKFLEESKTALSTRYLQGMQESFDGFLQEMTAHQAPDAIMDTSFEIRMREAGQTRTMESFSRGWRDAVELCVRLSLTDALYAEGELPFLLLDDPLVNLDDERLGAARALLDKLSQKYQILYFVCHKDRI